MELPHREGDLVLLRELGRGGMGVAYEAQDARGRRVAVKVLSKDLLDAPGARERFEREARLAASISHPRCVFVFGATQIDGAPAIVMELMSGETLDAQMKDGGQVPVERAVVWAMELLEGLDAAAKAGVIHRDVKPANCFLTAEGKLKVGDFGLSRPETTDVRLTQTGAFMGTPLYASPEQIRGAALDARSDQYSAAATLYALLAGRPPFLGQSMGEVISGVLTLPPAPLRSVRKDVPKGLDAVVLRALAKDPKDRFADHAAFREALAVFAPGGTRPAEFAPRVAAFVVDLVIVGLAAAALRLAGDASGVAPLRPGDWYFGSSAKDALGIALEETPALLYFALFEGVAGATPGKRLFGLRVLPASSDRPSIPRATIRYLVLGAASAVPSHLAGPDDSWDVPVATALVALLFVTARERNGRRAVYELFSGTRTVRLAGSRLRRRVEAPLDPPRTGAAGGQVGGFDVTGVVGEASGGRVLVARDPTLARSVWLVTRDAAAPPAAESAASPHRLRLLQSMRSHGFAADVYEAPGGASLAEHVAAGRRFAWPEGAKLLRELGEALAAADGPVAPERIWIDRGGTARLLDFPVGATATEESPVKVLGAAARALFLGQAEGARVLPAELPLAAEPTVRRLVGLDPEFASLDEARAALAAASEAPWEATRAARLTQILLAIVGTLCGAALLLTSIAYFAGADVVGLATKTCVALAVLAAATGFVFRGGAALRIVKLVVRTPDGRLAPRWLCAFRGALPWVPVIGLVWFVETSRIRALPVAWLLVAALIATAFGFARGKAKPPGAEPASAKPAKSRWTWAAPLPVILYVAFRLCAALDPKPLTEAERHDAATATWAGLAALWLGAAVFSLVHPDRTVADEMLGTRLVRR